MPKVVDAQERRELIADAVFALIERGGIEQVSLRNVAAESGLNIGSVRHYVDGFEGMLLDAVREMARRVQSRLEARIAEVYLRSGDLRVDNPEHLMVLGELAVDLLEELLPYDDERRREVVVWLAFCERSRVVPGLRSEARQLIDGSRQLCRPLLEAAGVTMGLKAATESLASVVDGLAIALLHDPQRLTRDEVRAILHVQLGTALSWPQA